MNTQELFEIVKQIEKENKEEHERIFNAIEDIKITLGRMETAVKGNGTKGIDERLSALESMIVQIQRKTTLIFLIGIAIGAVAMLLQGDILKLLSRIIIHA